MDNNDKLNQQQNEEIKISKKSLYISLGIIGVLILIAGLYLGFSGGEGKKPLEPISKIDSTNIHSDSTNITKKDSLNNKEKNEYEGEGEAYSSHRVISNSITLPTGQKLNFGDEVFLDWEKSSADSKTIYLNDPYKTPITKQFPISVNADVIIDSYSFDQYKNSFSLPPFSALPASVKMAILNASGYHDGKNYQVTQNANRTKYTLSTGDFDGDGTKDYAVVLDATEGQVSRLVIIGINKVTQKPYISYAENYNDKLLLKSFSKGASIYMNSSDFVKAPRDGIIISNEVGGVAIIYDTKSQKYKSYDQTEIPTATATDYVEE